MASATGISPISAHAQSALAPASTGRSVQALKARIQQDQVQLNDWTTCLSAKTPKGQAAIQKLSGEISAAKEQIARAALQDRSSLASSGPSLDVWA